MVLILGSNIFRPYCVKSRISGGLKAAHGTTQRQTWNLSQVVHVKKNFGLGEIFQELAQKVTPSVKFATIRYEFSQNKLNGFV